MLVGLLRHCEIVSTVPDFEAALTSHLLLSQEGGMHDPGAHVRNPERYHYEPRWPGEGGNGVCQG